MIGITQMPPCGFGNRLLYYYNLRQLAYLRECEYFCIPWEGHQLFEGDILGLNSLPDSCHILNFCLGEKFFDKSGISTREVFKLKNPPAIAANTCAIHFRGTDFHSWNVDAILDSQYYYNSIEEVRPQVSNFILFTDDYSLTSYQDVNSYLSCFSNGENTSDRNYYAQDFSIMSECDYIISSPSTYAISAGFIGKQKKIIHSKKWIESRVQLQDKFWCDLYDGGNEDYKAWRII